jgi:hypothetical protein
MILLLLLCQQLHPLPPQPTGREGEGEGACVTKFFCQQQQQQSAQHFYCCYGYGRHY